MKNIQKTFLSYSIISFFLLIAVLVSSGSCAGVLFSKAPVDLSAALPSGVSANDVTAPTIIVTADPELLKNSTPGTEVMAQLDDQTYIGIKMTKMRQAKDGLVWIGTVSPQYGSGLAFFYIKNSIMSGRIIFNGKTYVINALGSGNLHKITDLGEFTPIKNIDDALPAPVENGDQNMPSASYAVPEGSTQTTIDLLLLYTPGMAVKYPGSTLDTYLNSLVELANQAYVDSNINLKLNIVGKKEVNYPDNTNLNTALNDLTYGSGVFSQVSSWRDQYGADLVCLTRVFSTENNYCGLAWLLPSLNSSTSQGYGFSVIQTGSDGGYYCGSYTMAHEIGHNLGCAHDKDHASSQGIFSYSYGYDIPGIFATIMSYDQPTIGYFSNPDISYEGHAIGVEGQADNALTIQQTKTVVADYRASVSSSDDGGDTSSDYCASQGDSQQYEWISKVQIGSFSNSSAASKYSDFTSKTVNLSPGSNTSLTLTPGFSGKAYNEYWKIWIDYNKDGDFADSGELVFAGAASSAKTGSFTVSASASGSTRMRISMQYNAYPPYCGSFGYGEVEDYTVEFVQGTDDGGDDGSGDTSSDYCASQGDSQQYEWISKVQIGSFSNSSAASKYSDFTSKTVNLSPGSNTSLTLTPGFSGKAYNEYWKIWIDYNKDGDFADSGELVFAGAASSAKTGSFTVSASASGSTRMRISMQYNAYPPYCGSFGYGEVEDYTVSFGPPPEPVAPVAAFTADHTAIPVGGQVHFIDQSSNSPTSWAWQFTGGTPSASTAQNPTVTYNSPGDYSVTLTVSNSAGTDSESKTAYIHVSESVASYCSSQGLNQQMEWISKVQIGSFSNSSSASAYSDFLGKIVSLSPGQSVSVALTPGFSGLSLFEYWIIRIDYNKDGDFSDPGEVVFTGAKNDVLTGSFTVPSYASGSTRMRISMSRIVPPPACGNISFGEVEDYTVDFN